MSTQTYMPDVVPPNPVPHKRPSLRILQPEVTYTGAPVKPLHRGLPKNTESLCPECTKLIPAKQFADESQVAMLKSCAYREKIERQFSTRWDPKTQEPVAIQACVLTTEIQRRRGCIFCTSQPTGY